MEFEVVVLVVLAVVGSTLAEEESVCSLKLDDGEHMHSKVATLAMKCLAMEEHDSARLRDIQLLEDFRTVSKQYCGRRDLYQHCIDDITLQSESCQNERHHQIFLVLKELIETTLEITCQNEGELLATLLHGDHVIAYSREDKTPKCVTDFSVRLDLFSKNDNIEPATKVLLLYREAVTLKECLNEHFSGGFDFWHTIETFLEGITKAMKCVHPRDNTRIPCSTIVTGEKDEMGYCSVAREEYDRRPMKHLVAERVEKCLKNDFTRDMFDDISDLDGYRTYYKELCKRRNDVEKVCMHNATFMSSVCLNETEHQAIKLVTDLMSSILESGCVNDGEPLAIVTANVNRVHNDTDEHQNRFYPCSALVKTALDDIHTESVNTKKIQLYTGLQAYRDCFLGKIHGDNMAVFYTQFMLNPILRQFRCIDPASGASVLCHTLNTTAHTGSKECVFKSNTEGDPVSYSMFVDMGFTCMTYFNHIDAMTTLDELKLFFWQYSVIETLIENCLSDVTASSELCLTPEQHQMYRIFTNMLGESLKVGCNDEGQTITSLVLAMNRYKEAMQPCKDAATAKLKGIDTHLGNTTIVSMKIFRTMNDFGRCFSSSIPDEDDIKAESSGFVTLMLKRLQCVGLDGGLVPCETLVNDVNAD